MLCDFSLEANLNHYPQPNNTPKGSGQAAETRKATPTVEAGASYQYTLQCLLTVASPPLPVADMELTTRETPGSWSAVVVSLQQTPARCHGKQQLMQPINHEALAINSYYYINAR